MADRLPVWTKGWWETSNGVPHTTNKTSIEMYINQEGQHTSINTNANQATMAGDDGRD